jgi:hypothetical protein
MTCSEFREQLAELAVGGIDASERNDLLSHTAACASCQIALEQMTTVADRVLDETLEIEPPPGFEQRALSHLNAAPLVASVRAPRARVRAAVLVACALAAGSIATVLGANAVRDRAQPSSAVHAVRQGTLIRKDGRPNGQVMLVDQPRAMVIVTIDHPRPFTGRVNCELVLPNGQKSVVGSWSYDDVESGAWAVGIPDESLTAIRMNVLDTTGAVVASSTLN